MWAEKAAMNEKRKERAAVKENLTLATEKPRRKHHSLANTVSLTSENVT